ncbi:hypothetical protein H310_12088 [Aphanomyces invadans]|uniref:Inositol-tetrakisphosphate 1-kinase n=1 Tax=Aphanomyces invadans TaxID=157072 RepID=A0A024TJ92_9STRA|nr:hypothetical protein H310_12088 [Aphanomyces invadans]ETV94054.1 hypothetical protein H310_12088 [Aphanomyces invadans]|eukprot:XP_008877257.1 hypothetical protein H310_12088 [Aphanomyces invadans]
MLGFRIMSSVDAVIYRVGLILPLKKTRNGRMHDLLTSQDNGVHFIHIDLSTVPSAQSLVDTYGPLDAILHKLAHDMVFEPLGDAAAIKNMQIIRDFVALSPNVPFIDPLESVRVLTDRVAVCKMLTSVPGSLFHLPRYVVLDSTASKDKVLSQIRSGIFPLPVLAKSLEACGTDASHVMKVISRLEDIEAIDVSMAPIMLQEYVNHGGRLFKGYVLGDDILVSERTSLPDLSGSMTAVEFNTQSPFPTTADFHGPLSSSSSGTAAPLNDPATLWTEALDKSVQAIGRAIQATTNLSLFGFDVIMASNTNELMVVDVNYFPSFKEMLNFGSVLRAHVRKVVKSREK